MQEALHCLVRLPGGCVPNPVRYERKGHDMSSMPAGKPLVTGGVDTHGRTHHAAVVDQVGRVLGDQQFPATSAGYRELLCWLRCFGRLTAVGVEGTGSYGAGLARYLTGQAVTVLEVDRPDRKTRHSNSPVRVARRPSGPLRERPKTSGSCFDDER